MNDMLQQLRRAWAGAFRSAPPVAGATPDSPAPEAVGPLLRSLLGNDLKPRLDTLEGFAALLAAPPGEGLAEPARAAHVATILAYARDVRFAVEDLHDALRLDGGVLRLVEREVDAAELIEAAARRRRALQPGHAIMLDLIDGVSLTCDPDRVQRSICRLLAFASRWARQESHLALAMAATGDGGLAADLSFTAGATPAESDLGLWLARAVAGLHGGGLAFEVTSGNAVTVRFMMPAARIAWPPATTTVTHAA